MLVGGTGCTTAPAEGELDATAVDSELRSVELKPEAVRVGPGTEFEVLDAADQSMTLLYDGAESPIQLGSILIADDGIRRVLAIDPMDDDAIIVKTEPAALEDAFAELDFSVRFAPALNNLRAGPRIRFPLGDRSLLKVGPLSAAVANAELTVTPDIAVSMNLVNEYFHADYAIDIAARFDLVFEAHGKASSRFETPIPGMKREFVVSAGWVPVVITVELIAGVQATYDGDIAVTLPVTISERIEGSASHTRGGGWQARLGAHLPRSRGGSPRITADSDFQLEGKIFVKPRVTVAPFRVAGLYIDAGPNLFLRRHQANQEVGIKLGVNINATVGAAVNFFKLFGRQIPIRYQLLELFSKDVWTIYQKVTSSSCERHAVEGPKLGSTKCNVAGLKNNYRAIAACIRSGGGKTCLTDTQRYGEPLCGNYPSFRKTCNIDRAFTCVCYQGGRACFDSAEGICN